MISDRNPATFLSNIHWTNAFTASINDSTQNYSQIWFARHTVALRCPSRSVHRFRTKQLCCHNRNSNIACAGRCLFDNEAKRRYRGGVLSLILAGYLLRDSSGGSFELPSSMTSQGLRNAPGPAGPRGPAGPVGPPGPSGPRGPADVDLRILVGQEKAMCEPSTEFMLSAYCEGGMGSDLRTIGKAGASCAPDGNVVVVCVKR